MTLIESLVEMSQTPVSLLERLQQPGQQKAWTRFVDLYTPLLFYWGRKAGLQESDAADLIQDVFVLLVKKLPEFQHDGRGSFRGWLRTVTLNKLRETQRRKRLPREPDAVDLAELPLPDGAQNFWEVEYREFVVNRALELMRQDFQPASWQAFWEIVVSDRPAEDVAGQLGISVDAARAAKFRVLGRLRQELRGLME